MTLSKYGFRVELRQLIDISSSSTAEDYVLVTGEQEEALNRLTEESEKFTDDEFDAVEL